MKYVGLETQIARNNLKSIFILIAFPVIILGLSWLFFYFTGVPAKIDGVAISPAEHLAITNQNFMVCVIYILLAVIAWFIIAFFFHTSIINGATSSRPLERNENSRVYNLVENLCISRGMKTPMINIIDTPQLNAFASGLNEKSFTITLTSGILQTLNDDELEGVIAHELTHIRNKDVRLVIISIIFVGIFSYLTSILLRMFFFGGGRRRSSKDDNGQLVLIALALAVIGYFITILLKFALSRKREYLADAGAVELTHNPLALASALRKISGHCDMPDTKSEEISQLYIEHDHKKGMFSFLGDLFATHPPIEKRIAVLEQM